MSDLGDMHGKELTVSQAANPFAIPKSDVLMTWGACHDCRWIYTPLEYFSCGKRLVLPQLLPFCIQLVAKPPNYSQSQYRRRACSIPYHPGLLESFAHNILTCSFHLTRTYIITFCTKHIVTHFLLVILDVLMQLCQLFALSSSVLLMLFLQIV